MGRPRTNEAAVALFPFLAVLLCTMGSLILMLVVITRNQADRARKEAAAPQPVAEVDTTERDELDWEIEQLSKSRDKTAEQLSERRAALSHLEEHAQRLRSELAELEAAERLFFDRKSLDEAAKAALRAELQELLKKIAETEAKLAEAKAKGKRPPNFAIIPYDGEHGTRRRPIYIECRADSIILHPEGTTFSEVDFVGSFGPSNPLATCLRVVVEHYARSGAMQAGEQPYPLLLVRPSGITAYYVAMAALRSWDSDFGYELIDENWPLEFPPSDPQLALTLARAQDSARRRQQMIARAAPNLSNGPRPTFRDLISDNDPVSTSAGSDPGGSALGGPTSNGVASNGATSGGAAAGSGRRGYMRPDDTPMARSPAAATGYGAVGNGPGGNGPGVIGLEGNGPQSMNAPGAASLAGASPQGTASFPSTDPLAAGTGGPNAVGTNVGGPNAVGTNVGGPNAVGGSNEVGPNSGGSSGGLPGVSMQSGDGLTVAPVGSIPDGGTPGGASSGGTLSPNFGAPEAFATGSGTPGVGGSDTSVGNPANGGTQSNDGTQSSGGMQSTAGSQPNGAEQPNGGSASTGTPSLVGPRYAQNASGGYPSTGDVGSPGGVSAGSASAGNNATAAGGGSPSAGGAAGGMPGDVSGGASGGSSGMSAMTGGDPTPPQPQLPGNFQDRPAEDTRSLAAERGRNWGLPEHARRATGITRPVQIYCSRDRLTVLSDRGTPDKQIDMQGPTQEVVDELVSTVWGQVEDWGIAGRGMFWKPTLAMHVAPDGVERYRELKALLAESGLDVTGKEITVSSKASKSSRRGY